MDLSDVKIPASVQEYLQSVAESNNVHPPNLLTQIHLTSTQILALNFPSEALGHSRRTSLD